MAQRIFQPPGITPKWARGYSEVMLSFEKSRKNALNSRSLMDNSGPNWKTLMKSLEIKKKIALG